MDTNDNLRGREDRARRELRRNGYRLRKTPSRSWERKYYGPGYCIVDSYNTVVEGAFSRVYDSTIERVEWFAFDYLPMKLREAGSPNMAE